MAAIHPTTEIPDKMRALVFDGGIRFHRDRPVPEPPEGWALIAVEQAGICRTDIELARGYQNFTGIPGHEFVGRVTDRAPAGWAGRRVAGGINVGCSDCSFCRDGQASHCPERRALGIRRLDGCMAEFCMLPVENLVPLPSDLPFSQALWLEPLAAAQRVVTQVKPDAGADALVLGDGPIGILCAWMLTDAVASVTLVGRHGWKMQRAAWRHLCLVDTPPANRRFDLVVDATGRPDGFQQALSLCRPLGTVVLKTTTAERCPVDLAPLVVDEITVVGSRCGDMSAALETLQRLPDLPLDRLVTGTYPLEAGQVAFATAGRRHLKIVLNIQSPSHR